jgi:hypothetical protein
MELFIGSDSLGYFVYEHPGIVEFRGSYTQCLIVIGGVALHHSLKEAINLAQSIKVD